MTSERSWWETIPRDQWKSAEHRALKTAPKPVRDALRWRDEGEALKMQREMLMRRIHGPYR